ncbi:MAG: RecX family transcriptional regulator [Atribacterota bacterium]|nr:RecX family transcriptional regulator [Atribacterota bacterium]
MKQNQKYQKITSIKIKKGDITKRIISIDNDTTLEIDDTVVNDLNLYIDKLIDKSTLNYLRKSEGISNAKKDAIRYLSYRQRSEQEMINKLKNKKYSDEVITDIIQWLKDLNYINDKEFAISWIKDRLLNKPMGILKIRSELLKKGITYDIITDTICYFFENVDDEIELANKMLKNKEDSFLLKNVEFDQNKMVNLLKSRGFSSNVIRYFIEKWQG